MLNTRRSSDESRNGAVADGASTVSPNGSESSTAVTNPVTPTVRIRSAPIGRRSHEKPGRRATASSSSPYPPLGHSARRITTIATIGTRIASCGFTSAAMTARIAARSWRPRHSSRIPSSRNTVPKLSTWPQITESNQVIGLITTTAAAISARRRDTPSSSAIDATIQATARSVRMAGSLIRLSTMSCGQPTANAMSRSAPIGHSAYR